MGVLEALGELVGAAREGLLALSVGVGLGVMAELMEEEVAEVVGPKGKHNPERTTVRHGHETGEVTLGGRRVQVERPRVRSADGAEEVPLQTHRHFADRNPLTRLVLEQMLAGVSTRRSERTREPVGEQIETQARSTSKSAVSREFVARTRENLDALMSRRLDDVRLAGQQHPRNRPHDRRGEEHRHKAAGRSRCGLRRLSGRGSARPSVPAHPVRRDLGVLLRQVQERPPRASRDIRLRRRVDVDGDCADTKLVPSWLVGERTTDDAWTFMQDLKDRLANRVQLSTDGHRAYLNAVDFTFGDDVDFAMIHKLYGPEDGNTIHERKYSPNVCTGVDIKIIKGDPDEHEIFTSYVERQNLTMRMGMRRFTRLTNGFSKRVANLAHAVSLHYMHYNFARPHQSLTIENEDSTRTKQTPAMAAGVADHVWTLREIGALLDSNRPTTDRFAARHLYPV